MFIVFQNRLAQQTVLKVDGSGVGIWPDFVVVDRTVNSCAQLPDIRKQCLRGTAIIDEKE